ncbi:MAG: 50S ribosome-binding GTPase [DPANN group archaeon]|nr:50S ribosome-binding GTPase [DPANN group archaeon]
MIPKIPKVENYNVILNKAFRRAKQAADNVSAQDPVMKKRLKELIRLETSTMVVVTYLKNIHDKVPRVNMLSPFYNELISLIVDKNQFKKSMAAIRWAFEFLEKFLLEYKKKIKGSRPQDLMRLRTQFYGRLASVLKQIRRDMEYIEMCRIQFKVLPDIRDMPTIVIAGLPNVGKSSILKAITGANPDIQKYPFTTRSIRIGNLEKTIQIIDTPGLLDRLMEKRNDIEMRSVLALKYLANKILFVFDVSETCGYPLNVQLKLYREINKTFDLPFIICINKIDMASKESIVNLKKELNLSVSKIPVFEVSAEKDIGIAAVKKIILLGVMENKDKFYKH